MPEQRRALFYQPSCGISGDMHIAALLELGVPLQWLNGELAKLPVSAEYELHVESGSKMGISGTTVRVSTTDSHDHRHHSTIVKMIQDAGFAPGVERRALDIFAAIATAEGKIHGIPPEKVHFHEVGAVDSIVDIVAAALCIEYLQPEIILSNAVEVGSGYVNCAHGRFPVPAPATQELLAAAPCTYGNASGEATTPTGAAILSASVDEFCPRGIFRPQQVGYGVGHKDFEIPNVLRAVLGTYESAAAVEQHVKIEANIDDMSPEAYEPLINALFQAGAVDVYLQPIVMKKGRPANCITALCSAAHQDRVAEMMLNRSTTIGLRIIPFAKRTLDRRELTLTTDFGDVRVKQVTQPDGHQRWKVEHDDVLRLAEQADLDYQRMRARIDAEVAQQLSKPDESA